MRGGDSYCHFAPNGDGLFATTALVLSAGVAAAEVSISGNGRMGVILDGQTVATDSNKLNFSSRARVQFTLSGQTDGGLDFGASLRADQAVEAANGTEASIWISGAFGKIAMGDVVSAPEALFGDLPEVGYTDLSSNLTVVGGSNDIPYLTLDNSSPTAVAPAAAANASNLLYTYSAGAFSVAASLSDGYAGQNTATAVDQAYAVGAAYTFGNYTVGLGYEVLDFAAPSTAKSTKQIELAGVAKFGNTDVKAYFADRQDDAAADKAYGLGVSSAFGATTVMGYVQSVKPIAGGNVGGGVDKTVTWYGLGASYDLGGGASVTGGIADNNITGSDAVADLGIKFSF